MFFHTFFEQIIYTKQHRNLYDHLFYDFLEFSGYLAILFSITKLLKFIKVHFYVVKIETRMLNSFTCFVIVSPDSNRITIYLLFMVRMTCFLLVGNNDEKATVIKITIIDKASDSADKSALSDPPAD